MCNHRVATTRRKGIIRITASVLALFLTCCISLPEEPVTGKPDCVTEMYALRRELAGLKQENRLVGISIGWTLAASFFVPPAFLYAGVIGPVWMSRNYSKAEELKEDWVRNFCRSDNEKLLEDKNQSQFLD